MIEWATALHAAKILTALGAATFWFLAARVVVRDGDARSKGTVFNEGIDVRSTMEWQGWYNSGGAAFAALNVLFGILPS